MRRFAVVSLLFAIAITIIVGQRVSVADDNDVKSEDVIETRNYLVQDLPVWTSTKKFEPAVLMRLIQATVSPSAWDEKLGDSKMTPYPQGASIVISTQRENHDKISTLLSTMRVEFDVK